LAKAEPSSWTQDEHDIFEGRAKVLRTKASPRWYFRMWIPDEKRYVSKSLGTTDLPSAKSRAEQIYLQTFSDKQAGKKLFGVTLGELVQLYLQARLRDVEAGLITRSRHVTQTSHLRHLVRWKGDELKTSELDRNAAYEYVIYRRKFDPKVTDVTVKNEQSTINHMVKYGHRNGYLHFEAFEFQPFKMTEERRDTFTAEEYDQLILFMRKWVADKRIDETTKRIRHLIRDLVFVASNTMMRIGEILQLTWGDIEDYETYTTESGRAVSLVRIRVRGETSKVRKTRVITVRGGEYFKRHQNQQRNTDNDDELIFTLDKKRLSKKLLYSAWAELMAGIGLDYKERNVTWYSLRHFGITARLRADANVFDIAKVAGTSVGYIEKNYGHFDQAMSRAMSLKGYRITKDGIEERM
jgi:integrase